MSDSEELPREHDRERPRQWQPNPVVLLVITVFVVAWYAVTEDLSTAQVWRLVLLFGGALGMVAALALLPEGVRVWALRLLVAVWVVLTLALALFLARPELLVYVFEG